MEYFDSDNFLHDNAEATCGNKVLYSAMYHELGGYDFLHWLDIAGKIRETLILSDNPILTVRDLGNSNPDSLDNIVAFIYFNLFLYSDLKKSKFYFNGYVAGSHTWMECIKQLWQIRNEDRNYWWEHRYYAVGKVANWIPWHIQYYALKKVGRKTYFRGIFFWLWVISVLIKPNYKNGEKQTGNISQKNILWLIASDLNCKLVLKFLNYKKNLKDYFKNNEHPIRKIIDENN